MKNSTCSLFNLSIVLLLLFFSHSLIAQIEISGGDQNPWNPQNLVENVFLGDGVEVIGLTYSGVNGAVGYFQNGLDDVGLERGIMMTSGNAIDGLGPNNAGGNGSDNNSTANCPELNQLTSFNLFNVAAYEITFIPVSDTLRFRYVFASEEYPEFACSSFNDVFGFFISGPNPNGGDYTAENIALIPDPADPSGLTFTTNPVTINNVNNQGVNPGGGCNFDYGQYYNDNSNSNTLQYDAYLDAFTAQAIVIPCETYTIKLAIADAGDGIFDTAVFLEAKSFGTGKLEVTAQTLSLDGTLVEGCANGELCFEIPSPAESDIPLDYSFIGSAINGVDFEPIPMDLMIAQGDSSVCFPIISIDDGVSEPLDSLGIDVQIDPCTRDTFWVYFRDPDLPTLDLPPDTTICNGDSVYVDGTLNVVLPIPPTFSDTNTYIIQPPQFNDPTFAPIDVGGVFPLTLQENVIKSVCIDSLTHSWTDDLDIFLYSPDGKFIELTTDNGANGNDYINTCFTPTSTNPINVGPNNQAPASAAPFTNTFMPEGTFTDLYGGPTNGIWQLFVFDDQSFTINGALHKWSICFEPLYQLSYSWSPAAGLSCTECPDPWAQPDVTTTYTLTITDTYGCSTQDSITITVDDILPAPMVDCGTINSNSITFIWNDIGGATGGYQVNIDGQGWIPANGVLEHTVSGLSLNQLVTIQVQGVADCNGEIGTAMCMTPDCPAPAGSVTDIVNNSCFGDSNGSVLITGLGVNTPFIYAMPGDTNSTGIFVGLPVGDYTALVIDNVNCSASVSFTISEPDSLMSADVLVDDISCNGQNDGEGTTTLIGGTGPYNYAWSSGSTDSVALNLVPGQNFVTITDALGCTVIDTVEVMEPDVLSVDITADTVTCFGESTANAFATPVGGFGDYTYLWSDGQIDGIVNALPAGNIDVTVTDENGCMAIASIVVEQNTAISLSDTTSTIASCNGVQDGSATVVPTGGAGDYTYAWQVLGNQTTQTAIGLTVGTYTVEVTDALGCTATTTVSVGSPNALAVSYTSDSTLCFNSMDGQVQVSTNGGTPDPNQPDGYTYTWSVAGGNGNVHNNLPAGNHFVTITDANFCFEVLEVVVDSAPEITWNISADPVNCASGFDGMAEIQVAGGTGAYSYNWFPSAVNPNLPIVSGLTTGWVYVTVTDANMCSIVDSIEITAPNALTLDSDMLNVDCNGNDTGTATVIASNGTSGYTYLWSDTNGQTTPTATGLVAGTYTVTVTDANLCTETIVVDVTEPPVLTTLINGNGVECFGDTNGDITVIALGGAGSYAYVWSQGDTTPGPNGLSAGTYTVTVTDANFCTAVNTFDVGTPTELTLSLDGIDVNCFGQNGGSATATANGGAGNYTYAWSDGNNQATSTANSLTADFYTVTVTDGNMCTVVKTIEITQPAEINVTDAITNVICSGGTSGAIDIEVTGGVSPYDFVWSNNTTLQDVTTLQVGTYTVTITDMNNCVVVETYTLDEPAELQLSYTDDSVDCFMGSNGAIDLEVTGGISSNYTLVWTGPNGFTSSQQDLSDLVAGQYTVVATDDNGCEVTETITIVQPLTGVSTSISPPVTICFGDTDGTATVTAIGGTSPYTYEWNDPNNQTTASASDLPPGTYIVIVTDQSGCTFTENAIVNEQPEITVLLSQTDALCNDAMDGTATIDNILLGGTPGDISDFNIQWSVANQTGTVATNLQGGTSYEVTVTNSLGCVATASIEIGNPADVFATIAASNDVVCFEGNDGEARVEGSGGVAPYTYFWSPNANSQQTALATGLGEGNYIVTVSDVNGCTSTTSVQISEPDELIIDEFAINNVGCFGENTGALTPDVRGGNTPYQYNWSNGATTITTSNLFAGNYGLTVTDASGCTAVSTESVAQPAQPLTATSDTDDVICFEGFDGQIHLFPVGGTQPYMYSTDGINFNGSSTQIGLYAGTYNNVTVQDANGCEVQLPSMGIFESPSLEVNLGLDTTIIFGNSFSLNPIVTNATGAITYEWTPRDNEHTLCDVCPPPYFIDSLDTQTSFKVTVTDERGCTASDIITIFVKKFREVLVPTGFTPNTGNINDLLVVHGREGTTIKVFRVYDRWGELVYENTDFAINDMSAGWDGTFKGEPMNPAVYVWYLEAEFEDGQTQIFKGETTLIR